MPDQEPPISEIKAAARDAFGCDLPLEACPYPAGSDARVVWMAEYAHLFNCARGRAVA